MAAVPVIGSRTSDADGTPGGGVGDGDTSLREGVATNSVVKSSAPKSRLFPIGILQSWIRKLGPRQRARRPSTFFSNRSACRKRATFCCTQTSGDSRRSRSRGGLPHFVPDCL